MQQNVLIVDDNFLTRKVIKRIVAKSGHGTRTATQGAEAMDILMGPESFDGIITDYKMPVMNGLSFLQTMRKQGAFEKIPVLFYSAFLGELDPAQFTGLGPVVLADKPIKNEVINEFLEGDNTMYIY